MSRSGIQLNSNIFFVLRSEKTLILFFGIFTALCFALGIFKDEKLYFAPPIAILIGIWTIIDTRSVFFFLWGCIPFSMGVNLGERLSTDLPTEPLILVLAVACVFILLQRKKVDANTENGSLSFFNHPITILILLHLGWIGITSITSLQPIVSLKFFLAKGWYLLTFYFLAGIMLVSWKDLLKVLSLMAIPSLIAVGYVFVRHGAVGFAFKGQEAFMGPFFLNHVSYASFLVGFLAWAIPPFFHGKLKGLAWTFVIGLLVAALFFSYTRAAYLALIAGILTPWFLRKKAFRIIIPVLIISVGVLIYGFVHNNKFMLLSPKYEKTVSHNNFDNLLEATFKMEDISSMERVYRWVAAGHMLSERPILGLGSSNFPDFYKPYTVKSFRTYVSDNPEKSSLHNTFLTYTLEQGVPGLLIFGILIILIFVYSERIALRPLTKEMRIQFNATIGCIATILVLLTLNELLEIDKVGSFFWASIAMLVNIDIQSRKL
jgi:O-antigen ligase